DTRKARQALTFGQDFLDDRIEREATHRPHLSREALQPPQVLLRIAQAVDVVDADALQLPLRDETADKPMHRIEGGAMLDAHTRKRVDVKEAPVIDLVGGEPPESRAIVLPLQQPVQQQDRPGGAGLWPVGIEAALDDISATLDSRERALELRCLIVWRIL